MGTAQAPVDQAGFAIARVQIWEGQFPPPEAMERYEAILPGTFDRLLKLAERLQQQDFVADAEARSFQRADTQRGQYLGFAVTLLALGGAVGCAIMGHDWIAAAMVGVPVLSVARALVQTARDGAKVTEPTRDDQPTA